MVISCVGGARLIRSHNKVHTLTHKGMANTQYTNYNHTFNSLDKHEVGRQTVSISQYQSVCTSAMALKGLPIPP